MEGVADVALRLRDEARILGLIRQPDAVFIGGAVADELVFEACHAALRTGGRLVANAVTLAAEAALADRYARFGGTLDRIAVSHARPAGRFDVMAPAMTTNGE